jgi:hypothetical protein
MCCVTFARVVAELRQDQGQPPAIWSSTHHRTTNISIAVVPFAKVRMIGWHGA